MEYVVLIYFIRDEELGSAELMGVGGTIRITIDPDNDKDLGFLNRISTQ
jgi:hypothetical protein